ncbi:MAG: nuclease-related domain-containing protein [Xanthomonadales bacterium]|nr:nuclease-related domain-containing protein [Xanthomonadales bacterium]
MDGLLNAFLWLALTACVAVLLVPALPRLKERYCKWRVHLRLRNALPASHYTVLRDLALRREAAGAETVRIDHLVIAPYGIFVIAACTRAGAIFGAERDREWTGLRFRRRSRFPSPLRRAEEQARFLGSLLNLDDAVFHPMVVLCGGGAPETVMPPHVTPLGGLAPYIQVRTGELLGWDESARAAATVRARQVPPGIQATAARLNRRRRAEGPRFGAQQAVLGLAMMSVLASAAAYLADNLSEVPAQFPDHPVEWPAQRVQQAQPSPFVDGPPPPRIELPRSTPAADAAPRRPDRETTLLCTHQAETRRCHCFEPAGGEVYIGYERCRELSDHTNRVSQR